MKRLRARQRPGGQGRIRRRVATAPSSGRSPCGRLGCAIAVPDRARGKRRRGQGQIPRCAESTPRNCLPRQCLACRSLPPVRLAPLQPGTGEAPTPPCAPPPSPNPGPLRGRRPRKCGRGKKGGAERCANERRKLHGADRSPRLVRFAAQAPAKGEGEVGGCVHLGSMVAR
jgi:hypothetical protein